MRRNRRRPPSSSHFNVPSCVDTRLRYVTVDQVKGAITCVISEEEPVDRQLASWTSWRSRCCTWWRCGRHRRRGQGNVCLEPVGKDTLMLIVGESEMQTSST